MTFNYKLAFVSVLHKIKIGFLYHSSFFTLKPSVLSIKESLEMILRTKCSLSRFGDGEIELMEGRRIGFQTSDASLAKRLIEVATTPCQGHFVAIPGVFSQLHTFKTSSKRYWESYLFEHGGMKNLKKLFREKKYLDAFITRFYDHLKDKHQAEEFVSLWKRIFRGRNLLIVEGEGSRLGVFNDLFDGASSIARIICPTENAFSSYEQILSECKRHGRGKLVLIALGPTATVLAYDLAKMGYQALDVGHIDAEYEWYIMKAQSKEKIFGRYVNEIEQRNFEECTDDTYLKQIIASIP